MNRHLTKDDTNWQITHEKIFNIIIHQGNQIKTSVQSIYLPIRMPKIKNSDSTKR